MIALPLALLIVTAQSGPSPTPAATAAPSAALPATPGPAPSAPSAPAASPPAAPQTVPSASATVAPAATVTPSLYTYRFVPRQPDHPAADQPQIFAVYLNSKKLRSLGPIDIKVATSPNVVEVRTRSNGREGTIPRVAAGDFEAQSRLPKLPIIASGITTTLEFTAVSAGGRRVSVAVPVTLE